MYCSYINVLCTPLFGVYEKTFTEKIRDLPRIGQNELVNGPTEPQTEKQMKHNIIPLCCVFGPTKFQRNSPVEIYNYWLRTIGITTSLEWDFEDDINEEVEKKMDIYVCSFLLLISFIDILSSRNILEVVMWGILGTIPLVFEIPFESRSLFVVFFVVFFLFINEMSVFQNEWNLPCIIIIYTYCDVPYENTWLSALKAQNSFNRILEWLWGKNSFII